MKTGNNITSSRRRFIGTSLKLAGFSLFLLPLQKAFGNTGAFIQQHAGKLREKITGIFSDRLIVNTKTKVVHLPTKKIFTHGPAIAVKHQKTIDLRTWEAQLKAPLHFDKERSGIIIELLALQKLTAGINDKTLAAATNTLSIAFSRAYKRKDGVSVNKFNFRLHQLLLQLICLNNSITVEKKWEKFQAVTGKISYASAGINEKPVPRRMYWLKSKTEFDKQSAYILSNKTKYSDRLKQRAGNYKL